MKLDKLRQEFCTYVGPTESPIEQMLGTALLYAVGLDMVERAGEDASRAVHPLCRVVSQHQIGSFRVDFALISQDAKVVVECDGHDFHEKTKQQAAKDKRRDRELVSEGWTVLRFTGSEIWANPLGCASEAISVVSAKATDAAVAAYMASRGR